ncbi:MAG: hypothetical protein HYX27_24515 [Acidobacteria bacterium]|nr:hypothetical protein [Acidobacteriota bacterium]
MCGLIFIGGYAYVQQTLAGSISSLWWLPFLAAFATSLTTPYLWLVRSKALAGALIGLLSHLVMWLLFLAAQWIADGAHDRIVDVLANLVFVTFYSLLLMGWLTVPAGAILGRWYARRHYLN